jgi:glucokinase
MMASGSAIARMASEQGLSAQDAAEVARLAFQGNPLAVGIMHRAQQALANGIAATINVINPSLVVFGGGVSESLDLALIESLARKSTFTSKGRFPNLAKTALGMQAALIGAASLCFN